VTDNVATCTLAACYRYSEAFLSNQDAIVIRI